MHTDYSASYIHPCEGRDLRRLLSRLSRTTCQHYSRKMDISSTDKAGPFLFVNESSDLPPHSVGTRHDIRSHVRRYTTRQIKTGRKKVATERKLAPRGPRDLGHLTPEFVLHYHDFPCEYLPAISSHSEGIGGNLLLTSKDFPELRDTDDSIFRYYCKTCGAQLHSPIDLTKRVHDGHVNMAKHTRQLPLGLNPVEILGAGRVDPFLSYPLENPGRYLHEIIDLGELLIFNRQFSFRLPLTLLMETHILQLSLM
jgi:hypothetical protein